MNLSIQSLIQLKAAALRRGQIWRSGDATSEELPMTWMRVRVELARSPQYPEGSHRHGYEFILPLDRMGRLERKVYDRTPELCTVHRFWEGGEDATGEILRSGRGRWVFSWEPGEGDDEAIPHLAEHAFRVGEYLTVREQDGVEHTFRIVLIEPAPGLAQKTPRGS